MMKKEDARSIVTANEASVETLEQASSPDSVIDNITFPTIRKGLIEGILRTGKENAVSANELVTLARLQSKRELRLRVAQERNSIVIVTNSNGYFLPERDEFGILTDTGYRDTVAFYKKAQAMGISILKSTASARKAMHEYEQRYQIKIDEVQQWQTEKDIIG